MLSDKSRLKELYNHPVGRDMVKRLLFEMNLSEGVINNPLLMNMKVSAAKKLLKDKDFFDVEVFDDLIRIMNQHPERVDEQMPFEDNKWWHEAIVYQIYPRTFCDGNDDGTGDIKGIISKLDYLKDLGVNCIWLSPIFDSPQDDFGYDIRDYYKIDKMYGSMKKFRKLVREVHQRDMRLLMDLVVNHTSDEHEWFQKALKGDEKYQDYYIFKDKPNNWISFFKGTAWKYIEELDKYALHTFSEKQMDLNFENPEVREAVKDIVNFYLEMGVDGFRMDVINLISKDFVEGNEFIGSMTGIQGLENYYFGPKIHDYLHELRKGGFDNYDSFCVGETPGVGKEMAKLLTADYRRELDMVFSFDHLETPGNQRFDDYEYDMNYYKKYIIDYLSNYSDHYRMSLFFENHDNPRMISKIKKDPGQHSQIATMLATLLLTLKGTPFIFQGQEVGEANKLFSSIDEITDVESVNYYNELKEEMSEEEAFNKILAGTREHARMMMNWEKRENDVFRFYKKLISIRKDYPVFVYGDVEFKRINRRDYFGYYRKLDDISVYVEINLSDRILKRNAYDKNIVTNNELLISNYHMTSDNQLMPYEANVYLIK